MFDKCKAIDAMVFAWDTPWDGQYKVIKVKIGRNEVDMYQREKDYVIDLLAEEFPMFERETIVHMITFESVTSHTGKWKDMYDAVYRRCKKIVTGNYDDE